MYKGNFEEPPGYSNREITLRALALIGGAAVLAGSLALGFWAAYKSNEAQETQRDTQRIEEKLKERQHYRSLSK